MKAWISVSAAEKDREGRMRAMFLRWKKADLVTWLAWGRNERVGSKMMPRLRTWLEGVTVKPSMLSENVWVERVRDFGPMMRISDLLQFQKILLHP